MIFRTRTGTLYEIDREGKRFRAKATAPVACRGVGYCWGDWRRYADCLEPTVGRRMRFELPDTKNDLLTTSPVEEIIDEIIFEAGVPDA